MLRHKAARPCSAVVCKERARHLGHDRETVLERGESHACPTELILTIAADGILPADAELTVLGDRPLTDTVLTANDKDLCASRFEIVCISCDVLLIGEITAEARELRRERGACPRRRFVNIVARIRHMLECDAAGRTKIIVDPPAVPATVPRISNLRMLDVFILAVAQCDKVRRILAHGTAQRKLTAGVFAHKGFLVVAVLIVVIILVRAIVDTKRARRLLLVEPRTAIHKRIAARIRIIAAHLVADADRIAHAAEIRIADTHRADHAVRTRIARTDAE